VSTEEGIVDDGPDDMDVDLDPGLDEEEEDIELKNRESENEDAALEDEEILQDVEEDVDVEAAPEQSSTEGASEDQCTATERDTEQAVDTEHVIDDSEGDTVLNRHPEEPHSEESQVEGSSGKADFENFTGAVYDNNTAPEETAEQFSTNSYSSQVYQDDEDACALVEDKQRAPSVEPTPYQTISGSDAEEPPTLLDQATNLVQDAQPEEDTKDEPDSEFYDGREEELEEDAQIDAQQESYEEAQQNEDGMPRQENDSRLRNNELPYQDSEAKGSEGQEVLQRDIGQVVNVYDVESVDEAEAEAEAEPVLVEDSFEPTFESDETHTEGAVPAMEAENKCGSITVEPEQELEARERSVESPKEQVKAAGAEEIANEGVTRQKITEKEYEPLSVEERRGIEDRRAVEEGETSTKFVENATFELPAVATRGEVFDTEMVVEPAKLMEKRSVDTPETKGEIVYDPSKMRLSVNSVASLRLAYNGSIYHLFAAGEESSGTDDQHAAIELFCVQPEASLFRSKICTLLHALKSHLRISNDVDMEFDSLGLVFSSVDVYSKAFSASNIYQLCIALRKSTKQDYPFVATLKERSISFKRRYRELIELACSGCPTFKAIDISEYIPESGYPGNHADDDASLWSGGSTKAASAQAREQSAQQGDDAPGVQSVTTEDDMYMKQDADAQESLGDDSLDVQREENGTLQFQTAGYSDERKQDRQAQEVYEDQCEEIEQPQEASEGTYVEKLYEGEAHGEQRVCDAEEAGYHDRTSSHEDEEPEFELEINSINADIADQLEEHGESSHLAYTPPMSEDLNEGDLDLEENNGSSEAVEVAERKRPWLEDANLSEPPSNTKKLKSI